MKLSALICNVTFTLAAIIPVVVVDALAQDESARAQGALYASHFENLQDGDFPSDLEFRGGGMQIDRSQGDAMLRFQGGSWFHIPLDASLPDSFAIEFEYHTNESYAVLFVAPFDSTVSGQNPPSYSGYRQVPFNYFSLANTSVGVAVDSSLQNLPKANAQNSAFIQGIVPIRVEVRGKQARIFVDGVQAVMHPAATIVRTDVIEVFYASMGAPGNGYIGNIRVMTL